MLAKVLFDALSFFEAYAETTSPKLLLLCVFAKARACIEQETLGVPAWIQFRNLSWIFASMTASAGLNSSMKHIIAGATVKAR